MRAQLRGGDPVDEQRLLTRTLSAYLEHRAPGRVIVETCGQSFLVAEAARSAGHQVRIVAATLVRALGVGARRTKNDRRDAQVLSEASCRIDLPSVHVASTGVRASARRCAGCAKRSCQHAPIDQHRARLDARSGSRRSRSAAPRPCRLGCARPWARRSPSYVARQLDMIEALTKRIADANKQLRTRRQERTRSCPRLMTSRRSAPSRRCAFVAALDCDRALPERSPRPRPISG